MADIIETVYSILRTQPRNHTSLWVAPNPLNTIRYNPKQEGLNRVGLSLIQGRRACIHPGLPSNKIVITIAQCEGNSLKVVNPMSFRYLVRDAGISSSLLMSQEGEGIASCHLQRPDWPENWSLSLSVPRSKDHLRNSNARLRVSLLEEV